MSTPLQWKRIDDYHKRSECGRYFINRAPVYGGGFLYLAYFKAEAKLAAVCLSEKARTSFEAARSDCEAHFQKQHARSATSHPEGVTQ